MPALGAFAALLGLAAPAQGAPMFTDVTEEAGLAELINPNPEGASAHGGGVAMLDYDQDGLFDLLFVRSGELRFVDTSGERELGSGDSIVVPAGHAHRLVAESVELLEVVLPG